MTFNLSHLERRLFSLLLLCTCVHTHAEGYGALDYIDFWGNGHTELHAATQRYSTDGNFIAVGRAWVGLQYYALLASYLVKTGGQDPSFAVGNGILGKEGFDFAEAGKDNLCMAVTYAYDGFIAACRSMTSSNYYDIYLVKFDNYGNLSTTFSQFTASGTTTSGSNSVTGLTSNNSVSGASAANAIVMNQPVSGTCLPASTKVVYVSGTTLTLSANATSSGSCSLTFSGVKDTGLGGSTNHAFVRAIAYNSSGSSTQSDGGEIAIVGSTGATGSYHPLIATFDQSSGALDSSFTVSTISGTAAGVVYDGAYNGGFYYMISTDSSGSRNFYFHRFDPHLNNTAVSGVPSSSQYFTGTAIPFTNAGAVALSDAVPSAIANFGSDVVAVGSVRDTNCGNQECGAAFRCAAVALQRSTGELDTNFGSSIYSSGHPGYNNQGITLFENPGDSNAASDDCILNAAASPPLGGYLLVAGAGYNGTNYDYLAAELDTDGTLNAAFNSNGVNVWHPSSAWSQLDDVLYGALYLNGIGSFYAVGRSQNPTGYNGGVTAQVSTTITSTDTWTSIDTTTAPSPRYNPVAAWTGSKMVVWGGEGAGSTYFNDGGTYDPVANSWTAMTTNSAPEPRKLLANVWTGAKVFVWGGVSSTLLNDGGLYDPVNDNWWTITPTSAPGPRQTASEVWTGSKVIVWGGGNGGTLGFNTGGQYDPSNNSWSATDTTTAPTPRYSVALAWTGSKMLVWAGYSGIVRLNTGGQYDPVGNSWIATTTAGAPSTRDDFFTTAWTGSKMFVWGGYAGLYANDGGLYDPVANSWIATATTGAPEGREEPIGVWTGSQMIIGGGYGATTYFNDGGIYDPVGNTWSLTTTNGAPRPGAVPGVVWSGSKMLVWGGQVTTSLFSNGGGVYDPVSGTTATCGSIPCGTFDPNAQTSGSWSTTNTNGAPIAVRWHSSVWTGSKLVVWGGTTDGTNSVNTGGLFDPVVNSWSVTNTTGAPSAAYSYPNPGLWTGSEVIVWGGIAGTVYLNTGGLYDPVGNTWTGSATTKAPKGRGYFATSWTGSKLIVWGGVAGTVYQNTGGVYDPTGNSWMTTSTVHAPPVADVVSAVWTGAQMIVWGGYNGTSTLNSGGVYDPLANSWLGTNTTTAPSPRFWYDNMAWTGSRALIWGGKNSSSYLNTGGLYDPTANSWASTNTTTAPSPRDIQGEVWKGARLVVWGGSINNTTYFNDGGIYDPTADSWSAISSSNAPAAGGFAVGAWTGNQVLLWGGISSAGAQVNTGVLYTP